MLSVRWVFGAGCLRVLGREYGWVLFRVFVLGVRFRLLVWISVDCNFILNEGF